MGPLFKWLANAMVILAVAYILPGVHVQNLWTALVVALVMGILNILIKPLIVILTLPITIITFGLFLLVINALLVLFASLIVPGFHVDSFWWALFFSILVSFVNFVISKM